MNNLCEEDGTERKRTLFPSHRAGQNQNRHGPNSASLLEGIQLLYMISIITILLLSAQTAAHTRRHTLKNLRPQGAGRGGERRRVEKRREKRGEESRGGEGSRGEVRRVESGGEERGGEWRRKEESGGE